jgi:hypothetical protein
MSEDIICLRAEYICASEINKGDTAPVVIASKTAEPVGVNAWGRSQKTEVGLSADEGDSLRLDKMFPEGAPTGLKFGTTK